MSELGPESFGSFTMEVEFCQPAPELLNTLTGGTFNDTEAAVPEYGMEMVVPVKRTFWQWLLRKPKKHRIIYIPKVRFDA